MTRLIRPPAFDHYLNQMVSSQQCQKSPIAFSNAAMQQMQ